MPTVRSRPKKGGTRRTIGRKRFTSGKAKATIGVVKRRSRTAAAARRNPRLFGNKRRATSRARR